jgi:hypothetical protein
MILSAKNFGSVLILALFLFSSCEEPGNIDLGMNQDGRLELKRQSFTLEGSQTLFDSINSRNQTVIMSGRYHDGTFGQAEAKGYAQLGLVNLNRFLPESAVFDSARLELVIDFFHGNDFSSPQSFSIHRLAEPIYDSLPYFTSSSTNFETFPLGQINKTFIPGIDSMFIVRLDQAFGQDLFTKAKSGATELSTNNEFKSFFKGIAVVPGINNDKSVLGLSVQNERSRVVLFYRTETDTLEYDFTFSGHSHYSQVVFSPQGSVLQNISQPYQEVDLGTGKLYSQSGTGVVTKINLSQIKGLLDTLDNYKINLAELELTVDQSSEFLRPPNSILFYYVGSDGRIVNVGGSVGAIQVDGGNQLIGSTPAQLFYDNSSRRFKGSITGYVQAIADGRVPYLEVFVLPGRFGSNLNRMVIDQSAMKLNVYYTVVND